MQKLNRAWVVNLATGLVAMPWFHQIWIENRRELIWTWAIAPLTGVAYLWVGFANLGLGDYILAWLWITVLGGSMYAAAWISGVVDAWRHGGSP